MFGRIGPFELILVLGIALVVVGPSKLPELGKSLAKAVNEFKKYSKDIKDSISLDETDKKEAVKDKDNEDK